MVDVAINKNRQLYIIAIIIIVLILVLIIIIAWRLFTIGAQQAQVQLECVTDLDCPGTNICQNGVCIDECRLDSECQQGWECVGGTCSPGCQIDTDCPTDWTCENGACTPECIKDNDCINGQTCNLGVCQAIVIGCSLIEIPNGLTGAATDTDEITVSWNQSNNATGYIVYLGTFSGFNPGDAIQTQLKVEPDRIAIFNGLSPGTYYVRVSATNVTCSGTDLSDELLVEVPLPPIFKLCLRSNNTLCLKDTYDGMTGKVSLESSGATNFEFHTAMSGNHLRSIDSPQNGDDSNGIVCFQDDGVPDPHDTLPGNSCEYWTYDITTGYMISNCNNYLTVTNTTVGSPLAGITNSPEGNKSKWDLIP